MDEKGVIHGRFQMFHLKHLEYVLAAKMHCKKLYIGITHPDNTFTASSPNDKHGVTRRDNPMTFLERFEMIQGALEDFGVQREEYEIIPFPMNRPEYITQYAPADATYYMSICDAMGRRAVSDSEKFKPECGSALEKNGSGTRNYGFRGENLY